MPALSSWIPPYEEGLLPYFLLYSAVAASGHGIVTYLHPIPSLKGFSGPNAPPKTPLLAHVYGVTNIFPALIRFHAAYHIHNAPVYDLAVATFVGVLFLYLGEVFVWRTVRLQEGTFPLVAAGVGFAWMITTRAWYIRD